MLSKSIYSKYSREDNLCQSNGFFSLNLTPSSIPKIVKLLQLEEATSVGWIGCGDGRELFCIASIYPQIHFTGIDVNAHALDIARRVAKTIDIKNVSLRNMNALNDFTKYSHVYSTAIYGNELYDHLQSISTKKLCMLKCMWHSLPIEYQQFTVRISGSNEQRQLIAGAPLPPISLTK